MNIFFLASSKHEIYEFGFILRKIDLNIHKVFLLVENSKRNQNIEFEFKNYVSLVYLPEIYPSKNFLINYIKKNKIIRELEDLPVTKNDKFLFFHNSSLLFFISSIFFNKYSLQKVMFLTSNFFIDESSSSKNLKGSFFLNILCYPLIFKRIHKINFTGTVFSNTYIKDKIDFIISLKNDSSLTKPIKFNVKSFFTQPKVIPALKKKHLILIVSQWINTFSSYRDTVLLLIGMYGKDNILVKDHPLSDLNEYDLVRLFDLDKINIIPKDVSFENYIDENFNKLQVIYGPTSAALKYSSFLGLEVVCYQNLFSKNIFYRNHTLKYFRFHNNIKIIKDLIDGSFVYEKRMKEQIDELELEDVFNIIF